MPNSRAARPGAVQATLNGRIGFKDVEVSFEYVCAVKAATTSPKARKGRR